MDISSTAGAAAVVTTEKSSSSQVQKNTDKSFQDEMNKVSSDTTQKAENTSAETEEVKAESDSTKTEEVKAENKTSETKKTDEKNTSKTEETAEEDSIKNEETRIYLSKLNNDSDIQDLTKDLYNTNVEEQQAVLLSAEYNELTNQNDDVLGINDNVNSIQALLNANRQIESITQTAKAPTKIDYTVMEMSSDDAKFFTDLVKDTDTTLQNVMTALQDGTQAEVKEAAQKVKISATLMNTLSEATKTNQPFRINFDNDISVVIKIDRDGALSAKFIPGDKAVEEYLKQNIASLKQRFDDEELSYRDLSYSQQQKQQQRRNNKEK